ncbi:hypothetical protein K440DRAFT_612915 [Wilcoxina mikolae CBS 423.85]|nr:hypothetical protein K440DRAFT_612915 [Wilcoxina mikolae CBS 423.85]
MAPQIPTRRFSVGPVIAPYAPLPTTDLSIGHEASDSAGYTPGNATPTPNPAAWVPGEITQAALGAATLLVGFVAMVVKYREPLKALVGQCYVIIHITLRKLQIKAVGWIGYVGERVGLWFGF